MSSSETLSIESSLLKDVRILLGITGSVAAYRAIDLSRKLRRNLSDVKIVVSRSALRYVTIESLIWASRNDVYSIDKCRGVPIHVELAEWCNIYCICPCTLNTLSRILTGSVSDLPSLCAIPVLGLCKPLLIVPAMSKTMWDSPITRRLIRDILTIGNVKILYPDIVEGKAKLPSVDRIYEKIVDITAPRDMEGLKVLVTAGATREYIDPVKYIATPSSGIEGAYFAREAEARGAEVYLVSGYLCDKAEDILKDLSNIHIYRVRTTREMYNTVKELSEGNTFDIAIFAAAPLDYELERRYEDKIDTQRLEELTIKLRRAPRVISAVERARVKVGFKLEWNRKREDMIRRALDRMCENGIDIMIIHDAYTTRVFGSYYDTVLILDRYGITRMLENVHKRELARHVLTLSLSMLRR